MEMLCYTSAVELGSGRLALKLVATGNELLLSVLIWTKPKTLHLSSTWSTCSSTSTAFPLYQNALPILPG
ncbi:uncharacterized protein METZ01_LOCUS179848 [marine metagenome]|uniref:Uncharacterized protein n=1 Tax=marine metagenome TaxID=408172 RepID=A0A382CMC7_9ZZZZ